MIISKVCAIITFSMLFFDVLITYSSKIKISTSRELRKPVHCSAAGRMKPALTLSNALSINYSKLPILRCKWHEKEMRSTLLACCGQSIVVLESTQITHLM